MRRAAAIYAIRNRHDGKRYVGKTVNVTKRFSEHRSRLRAGVHANQHLQRAWNKYGEQAFAFEIIETVYVESPYDPVLSEREKYWVKALHATSPEEGYNLTSGGDGGVQVPSIRAKMSRAAKARFSSASEREKQGERRRRYFAQHSDFKAQSIANITNPTNRAKAHAIMRERLHNDPKFAKRIAAPLKTDPKPVDQLSMDGRFLRRFASMAEAERWLGKKRAQANISSCCRGIRNYAYGYRWRYAGKEARTDDNQGQAVQTLHV